MAITADKNTGYGPPAVTQKYRPLGLPNANFVVANAPVFSGLLAQRMAVLEAAQRWPLRLRLLAQNWNTINTDEATAGRLPPLVVVSSNRSGWIAAGFAAADAQAAVMGVQGFQGVEDELALCGSNNQTQSPPIFSPLRVGPNRGIYIVVHEDEYLTYRQALAAYAPAVTVIGWGYESPWKKRRGRWLIAGFGASRYAAIEFCKDIRRAINPAPWDQAWLIDDNVVSVNGFPGLTAIENVLKAQGVACAAAALRGGASGFAAIPTGARGSDGTFHRTDQALYWTGDVGTDGTQHALGVSAASKTVSTTATFPVNAGYALAVRYVRDAR